jgi:hypothetical protein
MILGTNGDIALKVPGTLVLIAELFRISREQFTCHMLVTLDFGHISYFLSELKSIIISSSDASDQIT